jgi:hypothetical protein
VHLRIPPKELATGLKKAKKKLNEVRAIKPPSGKAFG